MNTSNSHRLCEIFPVKLMDHEGQHQIIFIDWGKEVESRLINTRKEAIELYDIWMSGKDLPVKEG